MAVSLVPQISVFLDTDGNFRAEAPGKNGTRRKIDLPLDFATNNPEIVAELVSQRDDIRAKILTETRQRQTNNILYCEENHPFLAKQIWRKSAIFDRRLRKHLAGEIGNVSAKPEKAKSKPDLSLAIDLDL